MTTKGFRNARIIILIFVAITVGLAMSQANIFLALAGIIIGMAFMWFVRKKTSGVLVDERMQNMSEKAGRLTYIISVSVTGWTSVILMLISRYGHFAYLESLGLIFAYTTLFIILVYTISYYYYLHEGGDYDKE